MTVIELVANTAQVTWLIVSRVTYFLVMAVMFCSPLLSLMLAISTGVWWILLLAPVTFFLGVGMVVWWLSSMTEEETS